MIGVTKMPEILNSYKTMVDFLADYLGDSAEVVLHDLTDWHNSVIAIRNGHISGRKVGAPITDMGLSMIKNNVWREYPYRVNYKGSSSTGGLTRSATYFIKDDDGQLVGMLCINMDCTQIVNARNVLDKLINIPSVVTNANAVVEEEESFSIDVRDLVFNNIQRIMPIDGKDLTRLGRQEKINLVERLQTMGTFMVKGSITEVADVLGVSVPTIYRYLSTVKRENDIAI